MKHSHFPPTFTCDLQPLSTCVSLAYMATRSSAGHGDIPPKLHFFKQNGRQNSRSRDTTVSNKQKYVGTIISSPFWGVSLCMCSWKLSRNTKIGFQFFTQNLAPAELQKHTARNNKEWRQTELHLSPSLWEIHVVHTWKTCNIPIGITNLETIVLLCQLFFVFNWVILLNGQYLTGLGLESFWASIGGQPMVALELLPL
jgi:hypothetical protein